MPKTVNQEVRLRTVQIRASNPDHPPTIDAILDRLASEFDEVPSRGTIGSIVKNWDELPEDIRYRDMPFEWHLIERARIPWEASRWVLESEVLFQTSQVKYAVRLATQGESSDRIAAHLAATAHFTNRWATWSWRVHQARPDWDTGRVRAIASLYVVAEQAQDLLPGKPAMRLPGVQALLAHMPDLWTTERPNHGLVYELGIIHRVIQDFPEFDELADAIDRWAQLPGVAESESSGGMGMALGLSLWIEAWRSPLARFRGEHSEEISSMIGATE